MALVAFFRRHGATLGPLLLFLLLAGALLTVWNVFRAKEDLALQGLTEQYAQSAADQVQTIVNERIGLLHFVAVGRAEVPVLSERVLEAGISALREEFPGIERIAWIGPELKIRSAYPRSPESDSLVGLDVSTRPGWAYARKAAATKVPTLTPLIKLAAGGQGVVMYLPVVRSGRLVGLTAGVLYITQVLDHALILSNAGNFSTEVRDGSSLLFSRRPSPADPAFAVRRTVRVLDRTWIVEAMPTVAYVSGLRPPSKHLLVGAGLLLSLGIAVLLHFSLRGYRLTRENERRFRDLVEGSLQGVLVVQDQRAVFANALCLRLLGAQNLAELRQHLAERRLLPLQERQRVRVSDAAFPAGNPAPDSYEADWVRKDGAAFIALILSRPVQWMGREATQMTMLDITERKHAESELRQSDERLRQAVRVSNIGIFDHDHLTDRMYWSPEQRWIYGVGDDEPITFEKLRALIHPEDEPATTAAFRRAHDPAGDGLYNSARRILRRDGEVRWVEARSETQFEGEGAARRAVRTVGATIDITERKRAEEAVQSSRKLLQTILDTLPVYVTLKDREGRYKVVNKRVQDSMPPLAGNLVGHTFTDNSDRVAERRAWVEQADRRLLETGEMQRINELRTARKPGAETWERVTKLPLRDESGQVTDILTVGEDITERKQVEEALRHSEARLQQVVRISDIGIFDHDQLTETVYWSPVLRRIYGVGQDEPASLATYLGLIYPDDRAAVAAAVRRAHDPAGDGMYHVVHRLVRGDGRTRWLETRSQTLFEGDGAGRRPVRTVGATVDITERKRTDEALLQAQRLEAVGQLTSGIAHEFNNALQIVSGYVELVELRLGPDHPLHQEVRQIEQGLRRAGELTDQLLTFTRKHTFQPERLDLAAVVRTFGQALGKLLTPDHELQIVVPNGGQKVAADRRLIEQVLINFAINARDAMPTGGRIEIEVGGAQLDEAFCSQNAWARRGRYGLLRFSDTGMGMTAEVKQHVFEPFFTTKDPGKGTGLGLAVVYGIVQQHEGLIRVESEPGHGTTFEVYLPAA